MHVLQESPPVFVVDDFLSDEGVRLGLQVTYLDETLRITRCTTRALATSCAVHLRVS